MCDRHGLDMDRSERLLPLIKRALVSPRDVRERILSLVDHSLARQASSQAAVDPEVVFHDLDEQVLQSVAKMLHTWAPSTALDELPGTLGGLFDTGPDGNN
ncbi:MAG: hypothetical protein ACI8QC_000315 [Planctomycetota bacterium]|jgi:hypothetical protein